LETTIATEKARKKDEFEHLMADIIDAWPQVEDISEMPDDHLCSYCYAAKLRTMQQSPYSAYDEVYKERLDYVISRTSL